ncbi:DUF4347 domain-containing protein [Fusibacter bizertensis]
MKNSKMHLSKVIFILFMLVALPIISTVISQGWVIEEVVFVDDMLQDYDQLVDAIPRGADIVLLDGKKDGIAQISNYLQNKNNIDAIHIISHGHNAEISIGTAVLNAHTIDTYLSELGVIGNSLNENGDILLYGCNVASTDSGKFFVDEIARITDADVAASEDITGSAIAGGNWKLEYNYGAIEARAELLSDVTAYAYPLTIQEDLIHNLEASTWAFSRMAVGADGTIYLAHKVSNTEIAVKSWNGTDWIALTSFTTAATGDTGFSDDLGLAVDSNNKLHLVFRHYIGSGVTSTRGVKYGFYDGTNWQFTEIEANSAPDGGKNIYEPVIAVDSTNKVHIVYKYTDATNSILKYATNYSGSWVKSNIVSAASSGIDEFHAPSIVVDNSDVVHVAYVREDNQNDYYGNLYYISKNTSDADFPSAQKIVDAVSEGKNYIYTRLVTDGSHLYFTYYDDVYIPNGSEWDFQNSTSYIQSNKTGSWVREQVYLDNVRTTSPVGLYTVGTDLYLLMDSMRVDGSERYFFAMRDDGSGWLTGTQHVLPALAVGYIDERIFVVDSSGDYMIVTLSDDLKKIASLTGTSVDFGLVAATPVGNYSASAAVSTSTPTVGTDDEVTLTVKNNFGDTDTAFTGAKNVMIKGIEIAPDSTYGSFNGVALTADAAGAGQTIAVTFTNGVASANLRLFKSGAFTVGFEVEGVSTPATNNLSLTIAAGTVASLEVTTQPVTGTASGDAFATQPIVKLKDQYGNYCTTGTSASSNVVATAKSGTGSWTIGGTTIRAAVNGTATFTDLTSSLVTSGNGSMTFAIGGITVDSTTFVIPENAGKTLTADTTNNDVDNDIEVTFVSDAAFEGAITAVTYNGNALTSNQYTIASGKVTLHPSVSDNNYLRTPATGNVVITATSYGDSVVAQTISAGAVASLEIATQPVTGSENGDAFATQPIVKLKDQYGNYCTTGTSASSNVVATAKSGTGSWTIGGTTTRAAVNGTATFTDLTSTLVTSGNGSMTFAIGGITVDSTTFVISENAGKTLTADTTNNDVDNDIEVTFVSDAAFEGAITAVTYNGNALTSNQYTITSGKVTLHPSVSDNNYLRTPATGNVVITATSYGDSVVAQTISAGAVASLEIATQPVTGSENGDAFATQPIVKLKDQYGNYCTTGTSASSNVVATAKSGTGSWTIGGTTTRAAVNGTATFTDLTSSLVTSGNGSMTFAIGGITVDSTTFVIPENAGKTLTADTTNNDVDNDIEVTFVSDAAFEGAITAVTYNGNALTSNQYTITSGKVTLHPSVSDNNYLRTPATGNVVITATGYGSSIVIQTIKHGAIVSMALTQNLTAPASNGGTFSQQPTIAIKDIYGNVCTEDNSTVVTVAKEDAGTWTLTGTTVVTVNSGVATFTDLGATNTAAVSNAQLGFTATGLSKVTSSNVNLPGPVISGGENTDDNNTPAAPPTETKVVIIVNGKEQDAGKETKTIENGRSVTTVEVNNTIIENKIDEAIKGNTTGEDNVIQVPVADKQSEVAKVELTGDIVKKLELNTFDVSVKHDNVEYVIPAEEFTISKVAENLGISENDLKDIKVEVQITKLDQKIVDKYNEVVKANGAELVFQPVSFEVVAKTLKSDGSTSEVSISKFNNFVERVMELPAGLDPNKITTGIVFNADGTYSHVPTSVYQVNGKWYAKLNSLTNSNYSVVWNPITVKSVENHWAKDAVNEMASRLVITNPDKFDPDAAITRADFADYIVRALGLYREDATYGNIFKDVSNTGEKTIAILIANAYGIVNGYIDGTFKPDALISREEAMAMYQNAMKITKLTGMDTTRYENYSDYAQVSSWAKSYVKEVLAAHVFNGDSATRILPKSSLTYAEAAQAIMNLLVESKLIN